MAPLTSVTTTNLNGRSIIAIAQAPNDITSRRVTLEPIEDGWWLAEVPSLPGCLTQGETQQAALEEIKDAIELYIECLREDEELIPADFEVMAA